MCGVLCKGYRKCSTPRTMANLLHWPYSVHNSIARLVVVSKGDCGGFGRPLDTTGCTASTAISQCIAIRNARRCFDVTGQAVALAETIKSLRQCRVLRLPHLPAGRRLPQAALLRRGAAGPARPSPAVGVLITGTQLCAPLSLQFPLDRDSSSWPAGWPQRAPPPRAA